MEKLNKEEIALLKESGSILKKALLEVANKVRPGISSLSLDEIAEASIRSQGATPSFKNYNSGGGSPFPSALCVSINDEIVHGIPSAKKIIQEGDIVSLDLGANYKGLNTDMAITVIAGKPKSKLDEKLVRVTEQALKIGIAQAKAGKTTGDIGSAIEEYVHKEGFEVVRALVGHGIGKKVHDDPQIPNFGEPKSGFRLTPGIAIAIEPMVVAGGFEVTTAADGWAVSTFDGKKSAHFEHTVFIDAKKSEVVTQ